MIVGLFVELLALVFNGVEVNTIIDMISGNMPVDVGQVVLWIMLDVVFIVIARGLWTIEDYEMEAAKIEK